MVMRIVDVLRDIQNQSSVYYKGRFDDVPPLPGIYAWFYPLRITSNNLDDFMKEIYSVYDFDSHVDGEPRQEASLRFAWDVVDVAARKRALHSQFSGAMYDSFARIFANESELRVFRESLMRASLLMPPLYVGKTTNLAIRCRQHIADEQPGCGSFHARYTRHASEKKLTIQRVDDLLFSCIRTRDDEHEVSAHEDLLEEIMKRAARPPYSKR